MAERIIGDMKIRDVHRMIVENAATIGPDSSMRQLLERIVEDPRTRHAYVIDENNRLIGSIRLNTVLRRLFPMITAIPSEGGMLTLLSYLSAEKVRDLMNTNPSSVREDNTVADAVQLMTQEQVNELPVVNDSGEVVGEINFLEIIAAYLKQM